jgi:bifunctional UDP-N-acetylglucosamine pyrophosphorylase/glucosamine-1-phosphate N-acetyltransferase
MTTMSLTAAIILAAGESTRMKSSTPKVLHKLGGKTLLNRVMTSVDGLNPATLAVVVRFEHERVAAAAQEYDGRVRVVVQDEIPGTGRAVQCALQEIGDTLDAAQGPVLVIASDMPLLDSETLQALVDEHRAAGNAATVLTTTLEDPFGYGRIIRDEDGHVQRIVEQKDANTAELEVKEVNTSVYVFEPSVLLKATENLDADNAQKEFYLTDALEVARQFGSVGAYVAPDSELAEGINDRVQFSSLAKIHNKRVCEKWMHEGVTILDPDTTWIEDDVVLSRDVEILPGSFLQGSTVVEEGAVVGPYTTLIDAHIAPEAHVERSRVQESFIGPRANIGPWTYLRPGNELSADTKAGAFVEMKKAHIDEGTKVPHLSYIGDAHVGSHTNIGGGTITANYDGKNKHHTEIGADVHVGAGNMFVAPVTVGDGVTTGAGSVVRHDVEKNAMVYSENSQHAVENWTSQADSE